MNIKTSISLPDTIIDKVDRFRGPDRDRSAFIAEALAVFLAALESKQRAADELASLNAIADELNVEAEDVLTFQAPW